MRKYGKKQRGNNTTKQRSIKGQRKETKEYLTILAVLSKVGDFQVHTLGVFTWDGLFQ